jgi:hypothetical protein
VPVRLLSPCHIRCSTNKPSQPLLCALRVSAFHLPTRMHLPVPIGPPACPPPLSPLTAPSQRHPGRGPLDVPPGNGGALLRNHFCKLLSTNWLQKRWFLPFSGRFQRVLRLPSRRQAGIHSPSPRAEAKGDSPCPADRARRPPRPLAPRHSTLQPWPVDCGLCPRSPHPDEKTANTANTANGRFGPSPQPCENWSHAFE